MMRRTLSFIVLALIVCFNSFSQTLYVPGGSPSGIGISNNASNVGIATNTPLDKLHVNGNISIQSEGSTSPSFLNFKRISDGWMAARIGHLYSQSNFGAHLVFETNASASITDVIERMRITSGGNVGIGLTTPLDKLHVNGNIAIESEGAAIPSYLNFKRASDGWVAARIGQLYTGVAFGGNLIFETNASSSLTNMVERMRVTYDGKVGIGTTNPDAKLAC